MGEKIKTILIIVLTTLLLILIGGIGILLVKQDINVIELFNGEENITQDNAITDEELTSNSENSECPESEECEECPEITCEGSGEQVQQYIENAYGVWYNSQLTFKYKYPYGWHVNETAWNPNNDNSYIGYLYMDVNPITPIEGETRYAFMGYELGYESPSYSEQWYIDKGGVKLSYDLKVDGAFCYQYNDPFVYQSGKVFTCVYDFGRVNKRFVINVVNEDYVDEFQTIAESIEEI